MNASTLRRTPTGCVITPAGIVIGGAYAPPPLSLSRDAEAIQSVLLTKRNTPKSARMAIAITRRVLRRVASIHPDNLAVTAAVGCGLALLLLGMHGLLPGGGA